MSAVAKLLFDASYSFASESGRGREKDSTQEVGVGQEEKVGETALGSTTPFLFSTFEDGGELSLRVTGQVQIQVRALSSLPAD